MTGRPYFTGMSLGGRFWCGSGDRVVLTAAAVPIAAVRCCALSGVAAATTKGHFKEAMALLAHRAKMLVPAMATKLMRTIVTFASRYCACVGSPSKHYSPHSFS